jgi:hypothetical protein
MSQSAGSGNRLHLKDLFRVDLNRMYLAKNSGSQVAVAIYKFGERLEHLGRNKTRVFVCPPLPLLWAFRPGDGSPASIIHKAYLREVWRERGLIAKLKLLLALIFVWPVVNLASLVWFTILNGRTVKAQTGKGYSRQAAEQLLLSARDAVLPPWYYMFRLYEHHHRKDAPAYLHRFETKGGIYRMLRPYFRKKTSVKLSTLFNNKAAFAAHCLQHGLAAVALIALAEEGRLTWKTMDERLPAQDLFLKPKVARGGQGAERWDYVEQDTFRNNRTAEVRSTGELVEHIKELSRQKSYLVQPRLRNHPDLIDLSNGALLTCRIVTIEGDDGRPVATDAVLRIARGGNTLVDNLHAGGISAAIDMVTGELGSATDVGARVGTGWLDRHPETGVQIKGRRVPFWPETVSLVERGHASLYGQLIIGWDVPVLADGPCLVETNSSPDLDILQIIEDKPLGNDRLGRLLAFHVTQLHV